MSIISISRPKLPDFRMVSDFINVSILAAGSVWIIYKVGSLVSGRLHVRRMLNDWKESPSGVVILHTIGRGKTAPNCSPFVVKLETYLRMNNIPYEIDNGYPFSLTGKTPWITLNGEHFSDSQLIIEMLAKKFNKPQAVYSPEQRALGLTIRIMMDEHFYWGLCTWRYMYDDIGNLSKIFNIPPVAIRAFGKMVRKRVQTNSWAQGIGRLEKEDVFNIMTADLRALSIILGHKKFILGEEPCDIDCSVFGMLANSLWCAPGSPYETLVGSELLNLRDYCIRMKETFWPDWDKCLAGAQEG